MSLEVNMGRSTTIWKNNIAELDHSMGKRLIEKIVKIL